MSFQLTKKLYTEISKLKLLDKDDGNVRFRLKSSPFDDDEDEEDIKRAPHVITGQIFPRSPIYGERSYLIEIRLIRTFPIEPPRVRFLTPIYHPNVGKDGEFCFELLYMPQPWTPLRSLTELIETVVGYIDKPDADFSASFLLGKEYQDYPGEFKRKALEYVRQYGLPRA